jgi:hypothetical protein
MNVAATNKAADRKFRGFNSIFSRLVSKRYFSFPALASRYADRFLEPFVVWANR